METLPKGVNSAEEWDALQALKGFCLILIPFMRRFPTKSPQTQPK